jgi:hypothetical protein
MKEQDTKNNVLDKLPIGEAVERSSFWFNQLGDFEKWLKYCKMIGVNTRESYRTNFNQYEILDLYEYHKAINNL